MDGGEVRLLKPAPVSFIQRARNPDRMQTAAPCSRLICHVNTAQLKSIAAWPYDLINATFTCMKAAPASLPADLASELEQRFFWWEPIGSAPRSDARILAQAMRFASFADVRRLEEAIGAHRLAGALLGAEPGWFDERSWEFWRGRLALATGRTIPEQPPRRSFDAAAV
jgi:hypothetical protein